MHAPHNPDRTDKPILVVVHIAGCSPQILEANFASVPILLHLLWQCAKHQKVMPSGWLNTLTPMQCPHSVLGPTMAHTSRSPTGHYQPLLLAGVIGSPTRIQKASSKLKRNAMCPHAPSMQLGRGQANMVVLGSTPGPK